VQRIGVLIAIAFAVVAVVVAVENDVVRLPGRYQLVASSHLGVVRIDTRTGEVVACATDELHWPWVHCGDAAIDAGFKRLARP
jgi:hypothetical protein